MTATTLAPPTAPASKTPEKKAGRINVQLVGVALAAIVGAAIALFAQPVDGLTQEGVNALAVIVPTIILWLTTGTGWTSLFGLALLIVAGTLTPGQAWSSSLGNPIIAMILLFSLITRTLAQVGVIDAVAEWFLARKFLRGRPYLFLSSLIFSQLFLGALVQGLALGIIYLDIVTRMAEKVGVKKGHPLYTVMVQGVMWATAVVNTMSPVTATWPLTMIGLLAARGYDITFGMWFAVSIPFALASFVVLAICTRLAKPDVRPLLDLDMEEFTASIPPLTKQAKIAAGVAIGMLALVLAPDVFNALGVFAGAASFLGGLGVTPPAIAALSVLCLIKVKGQPIVDYTQIIKTAPMGVLIFIGAIFALSGPLGSETTGITAWLHSAFYPLLGGLSPFWIMAVLIIGAVIVTNFISNGVTLTLFFTLGMAVLYGTDANLAAFGVLMTMASNMAVLTQPCTPMAAIAFEPGHVTIGQTWKSNLIFMGLISALMIAFIPFFSAVMPAS